MSAQGRVRAVPKQPVVYTGARRLGIPPKQAVSDQAGATQAGYVQRRQSVERLAAVDLHIMAKDMCSRGANEVSGG